MNLPNIPLILVVAVLVIYIVWKLMTPAKKKPEQRRFSIRKHRLKEKDDGADEDE